MERKLLCVCMTLVMFCVGINVKAEIANGTCGENLTWVLSDDGTLNISGSGAMATWYSPSSTPWYSYISEIKKVVIGSSVTVIGNIAFYECSTLDSVRISNSVTSIGEYAFHGCKGLKSVEIPNSVTDIGGGAFSDCTGLASVTIPNSVTSIGESAFSGCTGLTSVTIPNSITHIAGDAFRGCSKISEVNISCKDEDDLANYVQRTDIFDVFYASLHATSKTHNIIINNKKQDSIIIPNSVTNMGNYAFAECKSLKSVHISNSTTRIGEYAFYYCTSLASVTIPNSVKEIRDCAFYQCSSLTSVTIPNSITYEAFGAFDGCSKISEVNVACKDEDDFVTYVQRTDISRIFHSPLHTVSRTKNIIINGEKRDSVAIPNYVKSIGDCAFYYCAGLKSLKVESVNPPQCSSNSFSSIYSATLYVPEGSVNAYRATTWWNKFQKVKTFTPSPLKPTDVNADGVTNVGDLTITVEGVLASSTDVKYDVNGDGVVNVGDLTEIVTAIMGSSSKRYKTLEVTDCEQD